MGLHYVLKPKKEQADVYTLDVEVTLKTDFLAPGNVKKEELSNMAKDLAAKLLSPVVHALNGDVKLYARKRRG